MYIAIAFLQFHIKQKYISYPVHCQQWMACWVPALYCLLAHKDEERNASYVSRATYSCSTYLSSSASSQEMCSTGQSTPLHSSLAFSSDTSAALLAMHVLPVDCGAQWSSAVVEVLAVAEVMSSVEVVTVVKLVSVVEVVSSLEVVTAVEEDEAVDFVVSLVEVVTVVEEDEAVVSLMKVVTVKEGEVVEVVSSTEVVTAVEEHGSVDGVISSVEVVTAVEEGEAVDCVRTAVGAFIRRCSGRR